MSEKVRISVDVRTSKVGSKATKIVEFEKEDWDEMDGDERQEVMLEEMFEMIDWDWKIV